MFQFNLTLVPFNSVRQSIFLIKIAFLTAKQYIGSFVNLIFLTPKLRNTSPNLRGPAMLVSDGQASGPGWSSSTAPVAT
jgi:hypothetical protein